MEDRPIRTLAIALALMLLLPATAIAQEAPDESHWPTADQLRRELQDIGYEFGYDPGARTQGREFRADWPGLWTISEAVAVDDEVPDGFGSDLFSVQLVDNGERPTFILFQLNELGRDQGALEGMAPALMEISSRLPDGAGLDAAIWYMANLWFHEPGSEQRTTLPCLVSEFDDGAALVQSLGDDPATPAFFGAAGRYDDLPGHLERVEACKALMAGPESAVADVEPAGQPSMPDEAADYTVTPDEAVAMIRTGEHTVIDVRTAAEFDQAHVVGAINIDVETPDFADRISELDQDEPYLLYCRSGRRSALAAEQMAGAGFTDLADAGGLADLARAGAPVE